MATLTYRDALNAALREEMSLAHGEYVARARRWSH